MSLTDLNAQRKWKELPKDIQQEFINNVFCSNCFTTTITDYTLHDNEHGILLKGKCKTCGKNVARLIEDA